MFIHIFCLHMYIHIMHFNISTLFLVGWYWKKKIRSLEKKIHVPGKNIYSPWKRNLGSSGRLVVWSSGPLVLWSCGPLVLWSSGPLLLWSCGPVVLWSSGPVVLWSSGPVWSCSALALWSQKFHELRANHVACFADASGGEALRPPPPPPSSQVQVECLNFFSRVLSFFSRG